MFRNRRLLVAALTTIALFSVVMLAAGLSTLQPPPAGAPPALNGPTPGSTEEGTSALQGEVRSETLPPRSLFPIIVIALALVIVIIFMVVTAEGRKMLVYTLLVLLLLAIVLLLRERIPGPSGSTATPVREAGETPIAPAVDVVAEPPSWLILGAGLGLALVICGVTAVVSTRLWRRTRRPARLSPLPELAEEARQALANLQAGFDLRDTIIRCYHEMGQTLQRHRGIRRSPAMTPEEFARSLMAVDLPQGDVWRITQLFERVRYGQHLPGKEEEAEAIASLSSIVQACEGAL
jgi:hypothetical protein